MPSEMTRDKIVSLLPLLLVFAAHVFLLAGILSIHDLVSGERISWYCAGMLIVAGCTIIRSPLVRLLCSILLFGGVFIGAASIGLFYIPAVVASLAAAISISQPQPEPNDTTIGSIHPGS